VDPVVGEVDRFGWPGTGLGWGELAEGTVRPGGVVMPQVLGQRPAQMMIIDDQQLVEELPPKGPDHPRADGVIRGLWVPRTSSTSCDQPVFVDHATDASAPSDTVLLKIDRLG
jgi:hypothetical protein